VYSETSKLTNRLIREGAKLVCSVNDILVEIGLETSERQIALDMSDTDASSNAPAKTGENGRGQTTRTHSRNPIECELTAPETPDADEADLLQHIAKDPVHIDDLVTLSRRPIAQVSGLLTMLELKGLVRQVGTMHYQLVA
jgi:predicted Rossmann fold nucleotide-binding protein DprA/Smf involved in DNA uptake